MSLAGPPRVAIGILGPTQALVDGQPVAIGGRNPRTVLALLALHPGGVVSADRLAEAVWGDAAAARSPTTLQVHISNLRRALGPIVASTGSGYRLDPDACTVDADEFERWVEQARRHREAGRLSPAAEALGCGLALWRGAALADLDESPELLADRHHLEELRLVATSERFQLLLDAGHHNDLVADLERLVAEHPFREDFVGQLMLALYRSGRQAEALRAYRAAADRLAEELGLDPTPALQRLERSVLLHSPSVELIEPDGPTLHWIDGDGRARRCHLDRGAACAVGRDDACAVALTDPAVSRRHARVEWQGDAWWVTDDGWSTNGTFVNGVRVCDRATLSDGDIVRCGETGILVRLGPVDLGAPRPGVGAPTVVVP